MHIKRINTSVKVYFMIGMVLATLMLLPSVAFAMPIVVYPDFSVPSVPCALGYAYYSECGDCSSTFNGNPLPQQYFNSAPGVGWIFNAHQTL